MDQSEWGKHLKGLRQAAKLSQLDVCRETKATPAAVYRWEAGRAVPQDRFLRELKRLFPELIDPPNPPAAEEEDAARPSGTDG